MAETVLDFIYNGQMIKIQCKRDEFMKNIFKRYLMIIKKNFQDVCFTYNGFKINEELKLEQLNNKNNEIKILVLNTVTKEIIKISKDIICPECGDICLLSINDYKMNLNKCCKEHNFPNILLEEFNDTQKINELTILCHECKKNKAIHNLFYKCCNCNFNLCPACKEKHNKEHIILNYELKNYLCNTHGEKYVSYCK